MRIYWSGAAYFLIADWQLRELSAGKQNLAAVLSKLNNCCPNTVKEWSGIELADKLNELSGTKIFSSLYQQMIISQDFPQTENAFKALGISVVDNEITLLSTEKQKLRLSMLGR